MQQAVITGFGAVCGFGVGVPALLHGLQNGDHAIKAIRAFDASNFPVQVAGEVSNDVNTNCFGIDAAWLSAHKLTNLLTTSRLWQDRKSIFGLLAAQEAWQMAGCGEAERDAHLLLALGLEQAYLEDFTPLFAGQKIAWSAAAQHCQNDSFRAEVDGCAKLVRATLQLRGPQLVNASACAAGGLALAQAAALIERGASELVLCGAADSMLNPFGLGGMARLGAPSPRNRFDACRPFDQQRDGLVIGEGAAMFVLESRRRAQARGAPILAQVAGYASNQDAYRVTAPRPDGTRAQAVMQAALKKAGMAASAIDYINAHGTGTPLNDVAEARAIRACFGAHTDQLAVSSIKGAIGHLMAASGAIEAAACVLALQHDFLPATAHYSQPDPECPITVLGNTPRATRANAILSNSFGFGGQNVALILTRAQSC